MTAVRVSDIIQLKVDDDMPKITSCILTNMCMVCDGTKVLVQDRIDPDWHGINFPGGHVEHGESFCESVIREVYEETGLTVESPRLVGIKNWFKKDGTRYIVLLFRAEKFSGKLRSSGEGEVYWVEREKLEGMKLAPNFDSMLKVFENDAISEMYWSPDTDYSECVFL